MPTNIPSHATPPTPGDEFRRVQGTDDSLQADPEMAEGPASSGRIAMYAVAIVVVLGAVFYGLNSAQTPGPTTAQAPASPPAASQPAAATADSGNQAPPNIRDVTPNRQPGTTTGAAPPSVPAQPTAPQNSPTGTEIDRSKGPANPK